MAEVVQRPPSAIFKPEDVTNGFKKFEPVMLKYEHFIGHSLNF
jgi:hypothetical protein